MHVQRISYAAWSDNTNVDPTVSVKEETEPSSKPTTSPLTTAPLTTPPLTTPPPTTTPPDSTESTGATEDSVPIGSEVEDEGTPSSLMDKEVKLIEKEVEIKRDISIVAKEINKTRNAIELLQCEYILHDHIGYSMQVTGISCTCV